MQTIQRKVKKVAGQNGLEFRIIKKTSPRTEIIVAEHHFYPSNWEEIFNKMKSLPVFNETSRTSEEDSK